VRLAAGAWTRDNYSHAETAYGVTKLHGRDNFSAGRVKKQDAVKLPIANIFADKI
jgi:hypothetical protein